MDYSELLNTRLDQLIVEGETLIVKDGQKKYPNLTIGRMLGWATSSKSLLKVMFGPESIHDQNFLSAEDIDEYHLVIKVNKGLGILRAAKIDFNHGHLRGIQNLIEADIFYDFLEQSEALLTAGYYQAAAVVAGAVLEDFLRKLCKSNQIPLQDRPKLDRMNSQLAKAGVYSKLTLKQITYMADLRNKAAHGKWKEFDKEDVELLFTSLQQFLIKHAP